MTPNSDFELDAAAGSTKQKDSLHGLGKQLFEDIRDIRELPNGYDLLLPADPAPILRMIQFLTLERLSFQFLRIAATAEPDNGEVWLHVTGCEGVREFLRDELVPG